MAFQQEMKSLIRFTEIAKIVTNFLDTFFQMYNYNNSMPKIQDCWDETISMFSMN